MIVSGAQRGAAAVRRGVERAGHPRGPRDYDFKVWSLSVADGPGFVAIAPEVPGCFSDGETPEAAIDKGYDAIACWMGAAEEMGRPVPEPRRAAA